MKIFIDDYTNSVKQSKLLHKVVYILSAIAIIFSVIFVFYMYIDTTNDLYDMYKRENITFVFFLIWTPSSIWLLYIFFYWLVATNDKKELFISNSLKEALFQFILVPIVIILLGILCIIAVGMIPFLIVEYWDISKIILLLLLSAFTFMGIYVFVSSNDANTIGQYAFTIIILGLFIIYPFSRSDTYNQFMAEYYLTGKDYNEAIDYLKFLALESDDDSLREKSGNLVINLGARLV